MRREFTTGRIKKGRERREGQSEGRGRRMEEEGGGRKSEEGQGEGRMRCMDRG